MHGHGLDVEVAEQRLGALVGEPRLLRVYGENI